VIAIDRPRASAAVATRLLSEIISWACPGLSVSHTVLVAACNMGHEELGFVFDSRSAGWMGVSTTVFAANLNEFLALTKETFDTAEELAAAGWVVD